MKKTLVAISFVFALIFALAIFNVSAANEGTAISNATEFENLIKENPQGTYYLTGDIDFGGKVIENYLVSDFSGTLDGNGYSIYNFSLTNTSGDTGLIKQLAQKANTIIKDVSFGKEGAPIAAAPLSTAGIIAGSVYRGYAVYFENVNVYANIDARYSGAANVGAFVGFGRGSTVVNCASYGSIKITDNSASGVDVCAGGMFGYAHIGITLMNCTNNVNIEIISKGANPRAGGLIGNSGCAHITDGCVNNGNISIKNTEGQAATNGYAGGIIGWVNSNGFATLNCKNNGTVSAGDAGAMIGIVNSHHAVVDGCTYTGKAVGKINDGSYVYISTELDANSTPITNAEEFKNALKSKTGTYHLANDIDFNGEVINDYMTDTFKGLIDGRGHTVFGFSLVGKTANSNLAMISSEGNGFVFVNMNIGKENAPIVLKNAIASDDKRHDYAIVCGATSNTIMSNVNVYADIDTNTTAKTYTAGVCGYNRYSLYIGVNVYGDIVGGSANPEVVGTYYQNVAGVAGGCEGNNVMLYKCKNYADVTCGYTSSAEGRAGGFMAYANCIATFIHCENYGDITVLGNTKGSGQAAGFLVDNNHGSSAQGSALFYYSANYGNVSACGYIGAMVGRTRGTYTSNLILFSGSIDVTKGVDASTVSYMGVPVARTNERPTLAVDFKVLAEGESLFPEVTPPEEPTPPTSDMSIVCVLGIAMIALVGAAVIVYRKRSCLSK